MREVEQLISDPRIPPSRRVLHALKAIGGLRHEEAAALRWRHYDPTLEPLGRLVIARAYDSRACEEKDTKSGEPRRMPVHPVLAKILAAWKLSHWERIYGRPPGPDDLIVPTLTGRHVNVSDAGHDLTEDLEALGLRVEAGARRKRGGHDLRSWFITTCQEHGAHRDLLRVCTHGRGSDVVDGYTRAQWPALCAEVAKLRVAILGGEVLTLATGFATAELRSWNRWLKGVSPEGLEAVLAPTRIEVKRPTARNHVVRAIHPDPRRSALCQVLAQRSRRQSSPVTKSPLAGWRSRSRGSAPQADLATQRACR